MGEMSRKELEAIRARYEAAKPGPWKSFVEGRDHTSGSSFIQTTGEDLEISGATAMDQDFIAHVSRGNAVGVRPLNSIVRWHCSGRPRWGAFGGNK